jgi:hypothetical protein
VRQVLGHDSPRNAFPPEPALKGAPVDSDPFYVHQINLKKPGRPRNARILFHDNPRGTGAPPQARVRIEKEPFHIEFMVPIQLPLDYDGSFFNEGVLMSEPATEHVTRMIFEAITTVVNEVKGTDDQEGLSRIGPILLSTGALIMVQGVGLEVTAQVIRELAARVERGDFSQVDPIF